MVVLCVAAHPDDESLGAGATLARHAMAGDEVYVLIIGTGAAARALDVDSADCQIEALSDQAHAAGSMMGVKAVTLAGMPDNRLDTVPLLDVVKRIEAEIAWLRPEVVYTHHAHDRNVDHRIVNDAVRTACRPLPGSSVKRVLAFEVQSSTEWGDGFAPTVFIDVSGEPMQRKLRALAQYRDEMRPFPHPRSEDAVVALARWRGATVGVAEAEAFVNVMEVA